MFKMCTTQINVFDLIPFILKLPEEGTAVPKYVGV